MHCQSTVYRIQTPTLHAGRLRSSVCLSVCLSVFLGLYPLTCAYNLSLCRYMSIASSACLNLSFHFTTLFSVGYRVFVEVSRRPCPSVCLPACLSIDPFAYQSRCLLKLDHHARLCSPIISHL